ncbi:hypothetical protein [Thalassospira sp.]|uniref:hypothetical protein n=1 Tax=Thalassospira sp. TaxID=1912094 RepID=UPI002734FC47|nr:hypothetical protein [Thalassospira sp.]MDP2700020.1 hypothetical protein [Thalassospira sp.]
MATETINGATVLIENIDLENSGTTQKIHCTNSADDFWKLMPEKKVRFMWIPPDLKRNADTSSEPLIAWRGDTRPPDTIFANGFRPRGTNPSTVAIIYRTVQQDIAHYTAVCLSGTISIGALFPPLVPGIASPPDETWIYGVRLRGYWCPTHTIQQEIATHRKLSASDGAQMAAQNLYAKELCTLKVDQGDVLCAIRVSRAWAGAGYETGGTFSYLELRTNNFVKTDNKPIVKKITDWWTNKGMQGKTKQLAKPA